jgi:hypothetical protein
VIVYKQSDSAVDMSFDITQQPEFNISREPINYDEVRP